MQKSLSEGLTYEIGIPGEDKCPSGYNYIQSLSACNDASDALLDTKFNGLKLIANQARLPYCWLGKNGNANYNANGDLGRQVEKSSRLICEKSREYLSYFIRKQ